MILIRKFQAKLHQTKKKPPRNKMFERVVLP